MDSNLRRVLIFSSLLGVISCTSLSVDSSHAFEVKANPWGLELIGDCRSLSGEYSPMGFVRTLNDENIKPARLESSIFGIENIGKKVNSVVLDQSTELSLTVSVKDSRGNVLIERPFNLSPICDGPWAVYDSDVSGSGDGSSVLSTRTITRLARSKSHELIVSIKTNTISKEWIFFRKEESTQSWFKFSEINR